MTASVPTVSYDALPAGLRIALSEHGTTTTLRLHGEWDLTAQAAVRCAVRNVLSRQPAHVVLDLSRVIFIDSSGVHVVIELVKRAAGLKIELAIIPGPPAVQRIFDICNLTTRIPFMSNG